MRGFLLLILFIVALIEVSCKKYAPAGDAFFIVPSHISVSTSSLQGSGNHKITDLWVYVDGQFKGAYPVDNRIPIVNKNSSVRIDVFAGIKDNGLKDTRVFWNFYESLRLDTFVTSGQTISRPFTFRYKDAVVFAWNENFEGIGQTLVKSPKSDVDYTVDTLSAHRLEGRYLHATGNSTATIVQFQTIGEGFPLPLSSSNVYMELNYKCNSVVTVGLIAADGTEKDVFYLNPQTNWNKTYISLSAAVNQVPATSKHKVFFRMVKTDDTVPELFLDNIKVVYI